MSNAGDGRCLVCPRKSGPGLALKSSGNDPGVSSCQSALVVWKLRKYCARGKICRSRFNSPCSSEPAADRYGAVFRAIILAYELFRPQVASKSYAPMSPVNGDSISQIRNHGTLFNTVARPEGVSVQSYIVQDPTSIASDEKMAVP